MGFAIPIKQYCTSARHWLRQSLKPPMTTMNYRAGGFQIPQVCKTTCPPPCPVSPPGTPPHEGWSSLGQTKRSEVKTPAHDLACLSVAFPTLPSTVTASRFDRR